MSEKQKIIPKLRFPEFEGEWDEKILENLCFKISDGIHSTPKYDNTGEYYFVNGNNLINGIIVINETTKKVSKEEFEKHKRELGKNTILLSINGTIGNISEYNNEKVVLGKSACYINVDEDRVNKKFILFSLKTEGIRNYFYSELTGSTIKNLSLKTIKNTVIKLPDSKEQQKIANCLSSLDEVITAETEKLDLLQDHKKGLLQQLFPQEGETQPKFRFPEFVNDGDWEEKEVREIFEVTRGYVLSMSLVSEKRTEGKHYPVYSSQTKNNGLAGFYNEYLYENAITWTTDGANAGDVNYREGKFYCTNVCGVLLSDKGFANRCIAEIINSVAKKHVSYIGNPKLMNGVMSKIRISVPPLKEQEKIASCLTNIDDLLEAQALKIKTLKKHKKGLMQQLFPKANSLTI